MTLLFPELLVSPHWSIFCWWIGYAQAQSSEKSEDLLKKVYKNIIKYINS